MRVLEPQLLVLFLPAGVGGRVKAGALQPGYGQFNKGPFSKTEKTPRPLRTG